MSSHPDGKVDAPQPGAASNVMVARQPIFDRSRNVAAYELLYRADHGEHANVVNGDQATAHVVVTSLLDIGLQHLVQNRAAFINATRELLVSDGALALPPERVVLEIVEDTRVDDELLQAVQRLAMQGYRFALDDFSYQPHWQPLIELAQVVKLDVLALSPGQLEEHVALLRRYDLKILAEKVETDEQFEFLNDLGCDYFQGYFFARPNIVVGSRLPGNKLAALRLLALVQDPETSVAEVTELIAQDPSLSYRLVRFVNSAAVGLPATVTSVQRAVAYLGMDAIRRWVSLTTIANIQDKNAELIRMTLIRARMAELLSDGTPRCSPDVGFTVGLFSTLDALMDQPLREILPQLRLTEELNSALMHGEGPHGQVLEAVRAYERGAWQQAASLAGNVSRTQLADLYMKALQWTQDAVFAPL